MFKRKGKNWEFEIFPEENEPKSVIITYSLFFFFGVFGAHHFHLRNKKRGFYILLFVLPVTITTFFLPVSHNIYHAILLISVILVGPLLVFDLFTIWLQVNKYNRENFKPEEIQFIDV